MILYILQARTSSRRLPRKVLLPILEVPMMIRQIERIKRSCYLNSTNKLIVATSTNPSDNDIAELCSHNNIDYFRGELHNVLDRFYKAAQLYQPNHIVRLTADCPLTDPKIIDKTITLHLTKRFDYTSNTGTLTFPHGLDVEVCTYQTLKTAWCKATLPADKEHVTLFIRNNPSLFNIGNLPNNINQSHFRWTVDEKEDFELVTRIYEALYHKKPTFETGDICKLLKRNPTLDLINAKHKRRISKNFSLEG